MKNVFVTGISGFCGGHLTKTLINKGYNVIGLARDLSPSCSLYKLGLKDRVTIIRGDILDKNILQRIIFEYKPQFIFHLAAQAVVRTAIHTPSNTFAVNVVGTSNLYESCIGGNFIKGILHCSTDKIYGEGLNKIESAEMNANGVYENSKIAAEHVAKAFISNFELPIVTSRSCNIFGAFDENQRIIPNTIRDLKDCKSPVIFKNDNSLRQYVFVEDVCDAYIQLLENIDKTKHQIFNIGGDICSQEEIVKKLIDISCKNMKANYIERDSFGKFEILCQSVNCQKIKDLLNWYPKFTLDEGLKKTWEIELRQHSG